MEKGYDKEILSLLSLHVAAEGLKVITDETLYKWIFHGIDIPNYGPNIYIFQYAYYVIFIGK